VLTAFVDLTAAYDSILRKKLWDHLEKIATPPYLLKAMACTMEVYMLIDGDKTSDAVTPNKGVKQGCPLSPQLFSLYIHDKDKLLDTDTRGAITTFATNKFSHCEYADDILMVPNSAEHLQCQLNKLYAYTRAKGLTVNTQKTKILRFFSAGSTSLPPFTYNGVPLEVVT
jgi:hypothetical protein